ncbi:hypothetical protein CKO44_14075 [Rubrivivax gelatinosus]|uniref:Uncharacterized protein n=1 Tax=Rubrivivax gelatinosus TaxID=28068 RepID=A0ABS1E1L2_RUBGE|nr:hypothetical protein [Rubrivivax gelatinosus]MBK1614597.1 hypothetical protein [Rubrivivax gelatinosus]MBK1714825.1 hypothetical protein [Rubrivivax gelatinosus]
MISRNSAEQIADDLLAQERARLQLERDASAPRVPGWYRVDGLDRLGRHEQVQWLAAERRMVLRSPRFIALHLACLLAVAAGLLLFHAASSTTFLWVTAASLGLSVVRILFIRRALARRLAERLAGAVPSGR